MCVSVSIIPSGSLGATTEMDSIQTVRQTFQQKIEGTNQTTQAGNSTSSVNLQVNESTSIVQEENAFKGQKCYAVFSSPCFAPLFLSCQ